MPVRYYVVDLLLRDNRSTLRLPYTERRQLLAELGAYSRIDLPPTFADGRVAIL